MVTQNRKAAGKNSMSRDMTVREVLVAYPETWVVFDRHAIEGDDWLDSDAIEPPAITLSAFARMHDLGTEELLSQLRRASR